ncbi:L-lactate permease [Streptomyces sp. GMR22]|uniref:L-lactate permease n=3 Tax=Streptomyces TaxID=1883 RepID=UPI0015FC0410|nr:L-lactate permease [Streptomyces sp. GMR22]
MMSPQNLAVGAAAVGLAGREGEILRRVLVASAVLVPALCLLVSSTRRSTPDPRARCCCPTPVAGPPGTSRSRPRPV